MLWPWARKRAGQRNSPGLNRKQRQKVRDRFRIEPLESRLLLNADPIGLLPAALVYDPTPSMVLSSDLHPTTVRDSDGTQIRIELDGHGHWALTQGTNGPELSVTGTDDETEVSIKTSGGDGRFRLGGITLSGPVEELRGQWIDLDGNLTANKPIEELELRSARGRIEAPTIDSLTVHGDFNADVHLTGQLEHATIEGALLGGHWYVVGGVEEIEAGRIGADWHASFTGSVERIETDGDFAGQLAASSLEQLEVGGNLTGSRLLIGADLGADAELGGTGANADHFGTGGARAR